MHLNPSPAVSQGSLQVVFDFSDTEEFDDIVTVKNMLLEKRSLVSLSRASLLSIWKNSIMTGSACFRKVSQKSLFRQAETQPFPLPITRSRPSLLLSFLQSTIEDVVKKLLEPVILSTLKTDFRDLISFMRSISGIGLIPQARIYSFLYRLPEKRISRYEGSRQIQIVTTQQKSGKNT